MTYQSPQDAALQINKLAKAASELGYEIVDVDGFLGLVESGAVTQRDALSALLSNVDEMASANQDASQLALNLCETSRQACKDISASTNLVRSFSNKTKDMASWVTSVKDRTTVVRDTLKAVKSNNAQIANIAKQVNTLAINAKIEAARAGDAGRGFAVVADAINDLSQKTGTAARQISKNIEGLTGWITELGNESLEVGTAANRVLAESVETDKALCRMEETIEQEFVQAQGISAQTERAKSAMDVFVPAMRDIDATVCETTDGVARMHQRMANLISGSELIVQLSADMGGATSDAPFIVQVKDIADRISAGLDKAVEAGQITLGQLFDTTYSQIAYTDPPQLMTQATEFLDDFLPFYQEPALSLDDSVVFCAAVDRNGYLPTHNRKFSHPQGDDVVWNTAHSRNRRVFDDRVGLKAGRSTAPFLLQVYRRDMGGGEFRVMKDLSAPIMVRGRHWGGLRLAYS